MEILYRGKIMLLYGHNLYVVPVYATKKNIGRFAIYTNLPMFFFLC